MPQQIINNGDSGLSARNKINENFTELYQGKSATTVDTFADLPAPDTVSGQRWWVLQSTGVWLINRKTKGAYYSNGVDWIYLGDFPTAAAELSFSPTADISATTIQGAIEETYLEKADLVHSHSGSDITSGLVAPARLGTGSPSASNFLRGDGTWAAPPGGGGDFLSLSDTPSSYAGQGLRPAIVNSAEDAIVFSDRHDPWMIRYLEADNPLVDDASNQNPFPSPNQVALLPDSLYEYEYALYVIQGTTSATVFTGLGGITGSFVRWHQFGAKQTMNNTATCVIGHHDGTTTRAIATSTTTAGVTCRVFGMLTTASGGGDFRVTVRQNTASGNFIIRQGSFARVRRVGPSSLVATPEWT